MINIIVRSNFQKEERRAANTPHALKMEKARKIFFSKEYILTQLHYTSIMSINVCTIHTTNTSDNYKPNVTLSVRVSAYFDFRPAGLCSERQRKQLLLVLTPLSNLNH